MEGEFAPDRRAGIFGVNADLSSAQIALIGVPWDVTSSYYRGARFGPATILKASHQLDLQCPDFGNVSQRGIWFEANPPEFEVLARKASFAREKGDCKTVDQIYQDLQDLLSGKLEQLMTAGKIVGIVGGDHSVPLVLLKASSEKYPGSGVLHIDAHLDLRNTYDGFQSSHASIFYNFLTQSNAPVVQVGARDYSKEEIDFARSRSSYELWDWSRVRNRLHAGDSFDTVAREIIDGLPERIHLSLDMDGLDPSLCPHTGTPVAGGLTFDHLSSLLVELRRAGKKMVSFDLCETSTTQGSREWDGNVAARCLYKLCGLAST